MNEPMQQRPQPIIPGLRVITCQGANCGRRIYLSDVWPSRRVAKQAIRDAGWRLDVSGGYCPRCK